MKYNININQIKALEWDLNHSECILIDTMINMPTWAESKLIDGEIRYFFSKNKILEQSPILSKRGNVDTIYRQAKKLQDKGLVKFKKVGIKDYWILENKIKEWIYLDSENNPGELGKKSESHSEKNPTNNNINNNNINNNINENEFYEEIYQLYIGDFPKEKKKYVRKQETFRWIEKVRKEYDQEMIRASVKNYKKVTEVMYQISPQYFFCCSKREAAKYSYYFKDFLPGEFKEREEENFGKIEKERLNDLLNYI